MARDRNHENDNQLNELFEQNSSTDEAPVPRRRARRSETMNTSDVTEKKPVQHVAKETHSSSKHADTFGGKLLNKLEHLIGADDDDLDPNFVPKKGKKSKWKTFLKVILVLFIVGVAYCGIVIAQAPSIDVENINSLLNISSTIYDDKGKAVDHVYEDQKRTIVKYKDLPDNLINAFISLEDKTFMTHHGFNVIRIFGAIKSGITTGHISGTSTITQQLARNVFLSDRMQERSINRKIIEAYYTVLIEQHLSKEDIITAYLNTIYLGYGCYGVETAAENYFGCKVQDLTLAQCAALAALPQAPDSYALVRACDNGQISKDDVVLKKGIDLSYVMNDISKERREICLDLMLEQNKISKKAYKVAKKTPLKKMLDIDEASNKSNGSSYFTDYIIETVIDDLVAQKGYTYDEAYELVYKQGLKIYSTMDSTAQSVVNKEFNDQNNFPGVTSIKTNSKGHVLDANGNIALYKYESYFNSKGQYTFKKSEYKWLDDGSLQINYGKRFNIYETSANGVTDYSLEFKNLYYREDNRFFAVSGGYVTIPAEFKKVDSNFNLIIDSSFFDQYPDNFKKKGNKLILTSKGYKLNYSVVQPQAAMVIRDVNNGQIKAMIGGREINGELLYNRAVACRQPGSSIKPLGVYSAALQLGYDLVKKGESMNFVDYHNCHQGKEMFGDFLTAASLIEDEPMRMDGKIWPHNSYGGFKGTYSMRTALQNSVNTCAVKILQQIGADYSMKNIKRFCISSLDDKNDLNAAALALGGMTKGVSPLEMSNAYTAFVNGGKVYDSTCYTKVLTKDNKVLLEIKDYKYKQAINPGVAFITRDMMFGVVSGGTGTPARLSQVTAGGKTGTTSDKYDIWFDGFTPSYAASLWIGNDTNMPLTSMSESAAALWGKIMRQIPKANKGYYSEKPGNVISVSVDKDSGYLSAGGNSRREFFIKGTQPTKKDTFHKTVHICLDSGYLATPWCTHVKTMSGFVKTYKDKRNTKYDTEQLTHYCNYHNQDTNTYPISKKVKLKPQKQPKEDKPAKTDTPKAEEEAPVVTED